jgi:hypothetical protein
MVGYFYWTKTKMNANEANLSAGYAPEQQERLQAEYSFVFCYHTEEFADEISAAVQDCDTVAFEHAGFESAAERQAWNTMLTNCISHNATGQQRAETAEKLDVSDGGAYLKGVLDGLQGSDKKIALLDMDEDNPDYEVIHDYWQAHRNYYGAVKDGSSIEEIKQAQAAFLQVAVTSFPVREAFMVDQLKALGHEPGKIGVVTGIIHPQLEEGLSDVAETSHVVIGPEVTIEDGAVRVDYDDFDLAIQQARAEGIGHVDDALLERSILKDVIESYQIDLGDNDARDLVRGLPEARISDVLQAIDDVRAVHAGRKNGFLRQMLAKDEVVHELRKVWPAIPANPATVRRYR